MRDYTLDKTDRICAIGGEWQRFWQENGGEGNVEEAVMGTVLWDAINGPATVSYLERLFYDARRSEVALAKQYRFDSATHERVFHMKIMPAVQGRVVVSHKLIRMRKHSVSLLHDLPHLLYRKCSQCMSCNFGGPWVSHLRFRLPHGARAQDAVCPTCIKGSLYTDGKSPDRLLPICG